MRKHTSRSEINYPGNHLKILFETLLCRYISKFRFMSFGMKYAKYIIFYRKPVGARLVVQLIVKFINIYALKYMNIHT